jgi:hypothetical protein
MATRVEQRERYAPQLAHAGQLAARSGCGQVAGVFSMQAGVPGHAAGLGRLPVPVGTGVPVRWDPIRAGEARDRQVGRAAQEAANADGSGVSPDDDGVATASSTAA